MFAEPPALTWDGENRLIRVGPTAGTGVPEGAKKAEYAYDYLGRRVQKKVWTYTGGSWSGPVERRYVWSGWLLLMELEDCGTGFQPVRKYTWGLDLAGQMGTVASGVSAGRLDAGHGGPALQGAGGIGGLLAVSDPNDPNDPNDPFGDFVCFYDGNGNVAQVVDLAHDANDPAGAIVAKYEYDPYGQRINHDPNVPEYDQPWRFSTKQFDAETGLGYWGYRYYSPGLGRWISRDPMEEQGGVSLYCFVSNRPPFSTDALGLFSLCDVLKFLPTVGRSFGPLRLWELPIPTLGGAWLIVNVTGSFTAKPCCDPSSTACDLLVCITADLDAYLAWGLRIDPRPQIPTSENYRVGYRDRRWWLTNNLDLGGTMASCKDKLYASGSVFVRGSAGVAGWGGQFQWEVAKCDHTGCRFQGFSGMTWGGATNITGASVEVGGNIHVEACDTLSDLLGWLGCPSFY